MPERITDEKVYQMLMLNGMNFSNDRIADHLGVSTSAVSDHINRVHQAATAEDADPEAVFLEYQLASDFGAEWRATTAGLLASDPEQDATTD